MTDKEEALFLVARDAQTEFWRALRDLELAVGVELDSTEDFAAVTLEQLLKAAVTRGAGKV